MIKNILLVLDNSNPGQCARKYALKIAKTCRADVTGLGLLDTPWITSSQPEPIGVAGIKAHRDEVVIKHSKQYIQELLNSFKEACKESGVRGICYEVEGFPAEIIENVSNEHCDWQYNRTTFRA